MNTAPIFQITSADAELSLLLDSDGIFRLFMFGMAPQNVERPYAVWQLISGSPQNYISGRPDTEAHTLQIDVYAKTASEARTVLGSLERALEVHCHVRRYNGESRDTETKDYRASMDVDWITYR